MEVNREFYETDITELNGEYETAKQINPDNYHLYTPLDLSDTFATSTNAFTRWRYSYGKNGNQWDYSVGNNASLKGINYNAPLDTLMDFDYHETGGSVNLALVDCRSDDTQAYISENYKIYRQSWGGDAFSNVTNQRPIIKYPLNIGALMPTAAFVEFYHNPNDSDGGYYTQNWTVIGYTNIANFLAKFGQYADTASHVRDEAFLTRLNVKYIRNTDKNNNRIYLGYITLDRRDFPIASVERYQYDGIAFEYAENFTVYNYATLAGKGGQITNQGIYLYDGTIWAQTQKQMTMGNSNFNGGALYPCAIFPIEEEFIPATFERVQYEGHTITKATSYVFGVDCEYLTAGDICAPVMCLGLPMIDHPGYSTYNDTHFATNGYLPIPDEDGIFHGDFQKYKDINDIPAELRTAAQNKALTGYNSGDGNFPYNNGNQNPNVKPDTNDKITETGIDETQISTVSVFNTSYAMTNAQIMDFRNYLWNSDDNIFNRIIDNAKYYNKPMDAVVNLMLFPFDVRKQITGGTIQNIVFGRTELEGVQGVAIPDNVKTIIDMGHANLTQKFKDFRDYAPYTTAQLYVPYCQPVKLDMSVYMGHKIGVKMVVDYTTGDATGVIYCDGVAVDYTNGKIGVYISMSGADTSRKDAKVVNDTLGAVSSIAGKDAIGAVTNIFDAVQNFGDIDIMRRGSQSSGVSTHLPQYCYILVERSNVDIISGYGDSIGYACNDYKDIASLSGFAVIENPNLTGITATEQEKAEILNLMQSGIFY